jgi:hypothetical protein
MNALLRPAVVVMVLALLAVGALGLRFALGPVDFREARRAEELERLERATFRRLESRRQVVQEVIARRCSLGEALAWLRELEREWPDYATPLSQRQGPRWPEEERHYQQVIAMVQDLLGERPEEATTVLRRLEEDYRRLRAGRQATATAPAGSR